MTRIVWRRLDVPGLEWAEIERGAETRLAGSAIVVEGDVSHRLEYAIGLNAAGCTRSVRVDAWVGAAAPFRIDLRADGRGRWERDGGVVIDAPACLDVDLGFSPLTNSLPIWRLGLAPGATADIETAWLRFPGLDLVHGRQTYERLGERTWRYRSAGFEAPVEVDADGLVVDYGGYWRAVGHEA